MTRILITILVYMFIGWLFCDIDLDETYTWYHGIWHGLFFPINWVRSWFIDALFKAENYTTAYNVFHWMFSILSTISWIFGGSSAKDN